MAVPVLTDRQRQVKERLERGMSAKQIGDDLGISRNAVYQTIQRLRKYDVIDKTFTPSGAPPRSQQAGIAIATVHSVNGVNPVVTQLLNELASTQRQLAEIANHLAEYIGEQADTEQDEIAA